ncbi:MAG: glycosyltransferase family 4 protein [Lysobacterales bacterium]
MTACLVVLQLLPALEQGGVEQSTIEIAQALVGHGHRALVVCRAGALLPALKATGAEHIEMDIGRKSLGSLRHAFTLRRLIARERVDIVHARSRLPAWLGWLALRGMRPHANGRRAHFVTTVHGLNSASSYSAIMTRGERVICASATVRAYVLRHYPDLDEDRLRVVPRGIDIDRFARAPDAAAELRKQVHALYPMLAGRLVLTLPARATRLKGHRDAIALVAELADEGRNVALWLAGADDPQRPHYVDELRARVRQFDIADRVAITAPLEDRAALYAASDVVLQLSRQPEAFGRTVIEALAAGRPVLGYAHGGVGELLAAHFPAGMIALGDRGDLRARAAALLDNLLLDNPAPPLIAGTLPSLAAMQQATLDVYAELAH